MSNFLFCRKSLSMCASVTEIIPDHTNKTNISGCILFLLVMILVNNLYQILYLLQSTEESSFAILIYLSLLKTFGKWLRSVNLKFLSQLSWRARKRLRSLSLTQRYPSLKFVIGCGRCLLSSVLLFLLRWWQTISFYEIWSSSSRHK